jgi:hypothetical protein
MYDEVSSVRIHMLHKNPDKLKDMINKSIPDMQATNNDDRTLHVSTVSDIKSYESSLNKCIAKWASCKITCNPNMVYNIFPLSTTSYILKI